MTPSAWPAVSDAEARTVEIFEDLDAVREEVTRQVQNLPAGDRFVRRDVWAALSGSVSVEDWRRLEAYKILIHRCLIYPCDYGEFVSQAIAPLGLDESQLVSMTRAQHVPVERKEGNEIHMIKLPISSHLDPAALYFSVDSHTGQVEQAEIFPDLVQPAGGDTDHA